jgi:hypothetical protein
MWKAALGAEWAALAAVPRDCCAWAGSSWGRADHRFPSQPDRCLNIGSLRVSPSLTESVRVSPSQDIPNHSESFRVLSSPFVPDSPARTHQSESVRVSPCAGVHVRHVGSRSPAASQGIEHAPPARNHRGSSFPRQPAGPARSGSALRSTGNPAGGRAENPARFGPAARQGRVRYPSGGGAHRGGPGPRDTGPASGPSPLAAPFGSIGVDRGRSESKSFIVGFDRSRSGPAEARSPRAASETLGAGARPARAGVQGPVGRGAASPGALRTRTDADMTDSDGLGRTRTDSEGLGRPRKDLEGLGRTRKDSEGLGRTVRTWTDTKELGRTWKD